MPRGVPAAKFAAKEAERLKLVAAATSVKAEIDSSHEIKALLEGKTPPLNVTIGGATLQLHSQLLMNGKTEWRLLPYFSGATFKWRGETRVSATGKLLFVLLPDAPYARNGAVQRVEVAHDDLGKTFGSGFDGVIRTLLGDTVDDLIKVAASGVAEAEIAAAKGLKDPVIIPDLSTKIAVWGAWA